MNALGGIDAVTRATASEWNATYFIFALIVGDTVGRELVATGNYL